LGESDKEGGEKARERETELHSGGGERGTTAGVLLRAEGMHAVPWGRVCGFKKSERKNKKEGGKRPLVFGREGKGGVRKKRKRERER